MNAFESIKNFLETLDGRQFTVFAGVVVGILVLISVLLMWSTVQSIASIRLRIEEINEQRRKVQSLLVRNNKVQEQKSSVDEFLAREKDFKIFGYFEKVIEELGLERNLKQRPEEPRSEEVGKDYIEYTLTGNLTRLNMKQLTDLLMKIADNKSVYPKKLDIVRAEGMRPAIDVTLSIATLAPVPTMG